MNSTRYTHSIRGKGKGGGVFFFSNDEEKDEDENQDEHEREDEDENEDEEEEEEKEADKLYYSQEPAYAAFRLSSIFVPIRLGERFVLSRMRRGASPRRKFKANAITPF